MEYSVAAYGLGYELSIKKKMCVLCDNYVYYYWNEITTCHPVNGGKLGKLGHFLDGGMIGQCLLTLTFAKSVKFLDLLITLTPRGFRTANRTNKARLPLNYGYT